MALTTPAQASTEQSTDSGLHELHELQDLISSNEGFAQLMRRSGSTADAAKLAGEHGVHVTPEALWRNRGRHGLPAWRA